MTALYDIETEKAALGCMLLSREAAVEVTGILASSDDWRQPNHHEIHDAVTRLLNAGHQHIDPIAVKAELERAGALQRLGGATYLHECAQSVPTTANAGFYARRVREYAALRQLKRAGERIEAAAESGEQLDEIHTLAHSALLEATSATGSADTDRGSDSTAVLDEVVDLIANPPDPTGQVQLHAVDLRALVPTLAPGQLVTLAGRPGMGKSILALDVCRHAAYRQHLPVCYVSLEMSRQELGRRIFAAETRIEHAKLKSGNLSETPGKDGKDDWQRLADVRRHAANAAPLHLDEPNRATLATIRARLRELARTSPPQLLVVDHVGLLESESGAPSDNRVEQVSAFSRGLKQIARQFNIPVLMVSQLNRNLEHRPDPTPRLADLRDSGSLEQDSDVVLLLHREDAHDPESPRAGEADVIVAKNRDGATGTVTMASQLHYMRFVDMAPEDGGIASRTSRNLKAVPN